MFTLFKAPGFLCTGSTKRYPSKGANGSEKSPRIRGPHIKACQYKQITGLIMEIIITTIIRKKNDRKKIVRVNE